MNSRSLIPAFISLAVMAGVVIPRTTSAAEAPTPAQALTLTPIQKLVEYTTPAKEEIATCTIRPEKDNNVTSWVVRDRQGSVLRRFADSNNDNVVDQWCYFLDGVEVYRDIDSNFNGKADEYRWFNTAGTRWALDKNEDGNIDQWRTISPHEVAEQVVLALKTRDAARFQLLLMTPDELGGLGVGSAQAQGMAATLKAAPGAFAKLASEQKTVTPQSRYIDFGSARPGTVPAGTAGSTKDVTVCDNAAALVQTNNNHDQVFLGTLVSVGGVWRLIDAPSDNQNQMNSQFITATPQNPGGGGSESAPSEEAQKLMAELETLDKQSDNLPADQIAANVEKRLSIMQKLSEAGPARERDQWNRQLIDVLSAAISSGNYPQGLQQLEQLQKTLTDSKADPDLIAHAAFQRIYTDYLLSQRNAATDPTKRQAKWIDDLKAFVGQYPNSADTAEALYQLGIYQEFFAKPDDAAVWYKQLVDNFPKSRPADKAKGALYRLTLQGKPLALRGQDMMNPNAEVSLNAPAYRGKVVLVQYWSTMGERWKTDMTALREIYNKRAGRDFEIVGVCLDNNAAAAKEFIKENKLPWKQIFENGGLDGRLANEMGVMTLPLMIMVDQKGNVANLNVPVGDVESELAKLIQPAAPAAVAAPPVKPAAATTPANALRAAPTSR